MRIAPIDVAHKNFSRKLMGFDADEVGEFLRDVADQMEELVRERNSLKEQLREKDLAIIEYKGRDETLKATITTATRMSEQIRQDSERESKLILHDASQKAEMIVKDSRDSLKRIYQEIAEAKRMRLQFEISMRSLIHAHLAMLDQGQMMVPDPQTPSGPVAHASVSPQPQHPAATQGPAMQAAQPAPQHQGLAYQSHLANGPAHGAQLAASPAPSPAGSGPRPQQSATGVQFINRPAPPSPPSKNA
jgi:cell division initiation protein